MGREPFDGEIEGTFIEVKSGLNAVRNLRASLLQLAYALQRHPGHRGVLVLANPKISVKRLKDEWKLASRTLRPELIDRLGMVFFENGQMSGYPMDPPLAIVSRLEEVIHNELPGDEMKMGQPDFTSEIFKILVHQWLLDAGPMTAGWLGETAGCSYPTVAKALKPLVSHLRRHSDRRFELKDFPKNRWLALVARGDEVRHTLRFYDRSGQPRSADALARRLTQLGRKDVAVGGVVGSRGHFPDLDISGTPRLDLTVFCPGDRIDLDFVPRLDPGLTSAREGEQPPVVILHVIRRKKPFFKPSSTGLLWADPVECLLDLHEARLEAQAQELFTYFAERRQYR